MYSGAEAIQKSFSSLLFGVKLFTALVSKVVPDELADMAQRYEEFRERNGYNNDRGGRGDRGGGGGGRAV